MKKLRVSRNQKGQGIIEGAVGLVMVLGAGIVAMMFILNSGVGMYYKQKLMPVTNLAAQFAAAHASDSNVDEETANFVRDLMPKLCMAPSNLQVKVETITVGSEPAMQVTVSNSFPLFGTGGASGATNLLALSDTEVVVW